MKNLEVAVVGADSLLGGSVCELLDELAESPARVHALDTAADEAAVERFDFSRTRIAIFAAGPATAARHAARAVDGGCLVIDATGHFRNAVGIPLVLPGLNEDALAPWRAGRIAAVPSASAALLALGLAPLHAAVGIERADVVELRAVSDAGKEAVEELGRQTADLLSFRPVEPAAFPAQIAFNVIPLDDGMQTAGEVSRLLGTGAPQLAISSVQVPVFYGHCLAVHLQTRGTLDVIRAEALYGQSPWTGLDPRPTPVTHASGQDRIWIGGLQQDGVRERGWKLWIAGDNMRRGSAGNAVRMARIGARDYL